MTQSTMKMIIKNIVILKNAIKEAHMFDKMGLQNFLCIISEKQITRHTFGGEQNENNEKLAGYRTERNSLCLYTDRSAAVWQLQVDLQHEPWDPLALYRYLSLRLSQVADR